MTSSENCQSGALNFFNIIPNRPSVLRYHSASTLPKSKLLNTESRYLERALLNSFLPSSQLRQSSSGLPVASTANSANWKYNFLALAKINSYEQQCHIISNTESGKGPHHRSASSWPELQASALLPQAVAGDPRHSLQQLLAYWWQL